MFALIPHGSPASAIVVDPTTISAFNFCDFIFSLKSYTKWRIVYVSIILDIDFCIWIFRYAEIVACICMTVELTEHLWWNASSRNECRLFHPKIRRILHRLRMPLSFSSDIVSGIDRLRSGTPTKAYLAAEIYLYSWPTSSISIRILYRLCDRNILFSKLEQ